MVITLGYSAKVKEHFIVCVCVVCVCARRFCICAWQRLKAKRERWGQDS